MKPSHLSVFSGPISLDHSGEEVKSELLSMPRQEHRNMPGIQSPNAKQNSPFLIHPGSAVCREFFFYFLLTNILIISMIMTHGRTKIKKKERERKVGWNQGEEEEEMNSNRESGS